MCAGNVRFFAGIGRRYRLLTADERAGANVSKGSMMVMEHH